MTRTLWLIKNDIQGQICFNGIRENTDLSCHFYQVKPLKSLLEALSKCMWESAPPNSSPEHLSTLKWWWLKRKRDVLIKQFSVLSLKFFLLVSCYRRHPKALPSTLLGSPLAPSWVLPTTPGESETTRKWLFTSFFPKVLPAHCLTEMPHLSWSLLSEDLPRPWLLPSWDPYGAPMRLRACISFLWPFPAQDSSKATC